MSEKKPTLVPLKEIMADLLRSPDLPFNPQDALIWRLWGEVVGDVIARNAKPVWIKNGRLRVKVSDSIWLQELSFMEKNIRRNLNERLGRAAINKIEFKIRSR